MDLAGSWLHARRLARRAAVLLLVPAAPVAVDGQVLTGIVRERGTGTVIGEAAVSLVDSAGGGAGFHRASYYGRFRLLVPGPGKFAIDVRRIGYRPWRSPLIDFSGADTLEYEALLERLPQQLAGLTIRAERDELLDLKFMGMNPRAFAGDMITPSQIEEASFGARHYGDIISHLAIPWVFYDGGAQCIRTVRSRGCLMVFVDDMRMARGDDMEAQWAALGLVDPSSIDHMLLLRAADAGVFFGTGSFSGVLLIWTKGYSTLLRQMNRRKRE